MNIAVRYYSQSGRTEKIAKAIAGGAGVEAVSITDEPVLTEKTDLLFLGGAPYANIMAHDLKVYAEKLTSDNVKKVVLFTTSNWSRRTVLALKKLLKANGVAVADDSFYAQAAKIDSRLAAAEAFGRSVSKE
ncbi:MAG: flavodoxin [Eubacterium sp.]|nr:flavodoxin [Eubacterium sp.]